MLQKLREYLANTPREQIDRDWAAVKAKGLQGPTAKELIATFRLTPAYQQTDTKAFLTEAASPHLHFELQPEDSNYVMAA